MALWLGVMLLVFVVYILMRRKNRKLPPGPIGLPMFGYYFSLRKKPLETLNRLAEKYGNIVGFYLGPKYVVCLNDWESVKDALSQKATLDKPIKLLHKYPYKFGFGACNGENWVGTRHLISKVMKDSLRVNRWEDLMQQEASNVTEVITKECEKSIEIGTVFCDSLAKLMPLLFLNKTNHSTTKMIAGSVRFIDESLTFVQMSNFSTPLTVFLWMLGLEELPPIIEKTKDFVKFVSDSVNSIKHNLEVTDSFIYRLAEAIQNYKKVKEDTFDSEDILKGSTIALISAGNGTIRASTVWTLIAMAEHPDKQNKVHEELDRVIGKNGSIRWSERSLVPYTLATLFESMRWKLRGLTVRETNQDTQIQGYNIRKGTYVMINNFRLHRDSKYWKDPEQFIPERFLLEDGRKVNMEPESFNPFSYGKRNCPAKLLAQMVILQYFTAIMQKFKVVPKEGDKVKYGATYRFTYQAKDAELRFIPR